MAYSKRSSFHNWLEKVHFLENFKNFDSTVVYCGYRYFFRRIEEIVSLYHIKFHKYETQDYKTNLFSRLSSCQNFHPMADLD